MSKQTNGKSKFLEMPGFGGILTFQPKSAIEEKAIELIHLSLKLKNLEIEKDKLENSIGQKWEELRTVVLESEIKMPIDEEYCKIVLNG